MRDVVDGNAEHGVTWVHSYVNPDRTATFCPSTTVPHRKRSGWPRETTAWWIGGITEVSVLDPYFYH